ncbi:MAG: stage V sporulation protein D [Sarcina sp.]
MKKKGKRQGEYDVKVKERTLILGLLAGVVFLFLTCMTVFRVIIRGNYYKQLAKEQVLNEIEINAKRGRILDRNGKDLAISGDVYRVDADLVSLRTTITKKAEKENKTEIKQKEELVLKLSEILKVDKDEVLKKLDAKLDSGLNATSAILARQISKDQADAIKELKYYGLLISSDTKRYYPNNDFSAYVLGNVNSDSEGLNGIELYYDSILSGVSGIRVAELDKLQNELPNEKASFTEPIDGKDIILTIDEKIQFFAEQAAKKALVEHGAKAVNILVMDPNTSEILALASNPDYNLNFPYEGFESFSGKTKEDKTQQMWRNRIISDLYEPGSTFKVITAAAALEEKLANKGETYVCTGFKVIDERRIHCWKKEGHGPQTFMQILENSCNVGFMELGKKLGSEKLYEYIKEFGFGALTGIDLNGEAQGIIKTPENMSDSDLATISFGQTNAVSMIQLLTGFNATINGGYLITPHLMKEVAIRDDKGGLIVEDTFNSEKTQVVSEETSKVIRESLESVVKNGTGLPSYIEGVKIGGKTGTAQMVDDNGGYGAGRIASFIAMAPADNPKVSMLVTIVDPKNGVASGSSMAAPVIKEMFEKMLSYKSINDIDFYSGSAESIILPEIRGMKKEEAIRLLELKNLKVNISGEGSIVAKMNILPGTIVKKNAVIDIELTKGNTVDKNINMPNLVGHTVESAKNILEQFGLTGKFDREMGIVIGQGVKQNKTIKAGDSIKFNVKEENNKVE